MIYLIGHILSRFQKTLRMSAVLSVIAFELFSPRQLVYAASQVNESGMGLVSRQSMEKRRSLILPAYAPITKRDRPAFLEREYRVMGQHIMESSAYNSLPNQTDGSPYITAAGTFTRFGVVASNYFPLGTKVRFPDIFGDQVFIVEDRMNRRYHKVIDVWMGDKSDALAYGRKRVRVQVVK